MKKLQLEQIAIHSFVTQSKSEKIMAGSIIGTLCGCNTFNECGTYGDPACGGTDPNFDCPPSYIPYC